MLSDEAFAELRAEFKQALPALIEGSPDRTDLMASSKRINRGRITMKEVIGAVSYEADVHVGSITGSRATKHISRARALAMLVVRDGRPDLPNSQIATAFNREKSTVRLAIKRAAGLLQTDPLFNDCYQRVRWRLGLA